MATSPFVSRLIFGSIGGFICWMIKGFKGKLKEEFSDSKRIRNFFVGIFTVMLIVIPILWLYR